MQQVQQQWNEIRPLYPNKFTLVLLNPNLSFFWKHLLNPNLSLFENRVDPDRMASDDAIWSGSTLFSTLIVITCIQLESCRLTGLTLKAPITTAADDKVCEIFTSFRQKIWYFMRIACQQTILINYHALFVIFEKQQNLKLSSAANYRWRFKV